MLVFCLKYKGNNAIWEGKNVNYTTLQVPGNKWKKKLQEYLEVQEVSTDH